MTTIFLTPHFILKEVVPKEIYNIFGENSRWLINQPIMNVAEHLRVKLDRSIIINSWHTGGDLNYCGYRPPDCATGAKYSQHKMGNALDLHIKGLDPEEVRIYIRNNFAELNKLGLTTIELDTPTWVHCDTRWTGSDKLLEVPFQ